MRIRRPALSIPVLVAGTALQVGCPSPGTSGGGPADIAVTRVAGEPLVVQRLAQDPAGAFVVGTPLPCDGPRCLLASRDIVAVQTDRGLWVRRTGEVEGQTLPSTPAPDEPAGVTALRAALTAPAAETLTATGRHPLLPPLPAALRTCGDVAVGGGFGYHIIRNDGDVWQRIEWVTPPTAPDVLALAPDAYPIVDGGTGGLCGWGEQRRGERRWTVHHATSATVVEAVADREHLPARCRGEGRVDVETATGVVRIAKDGSTGPIPAADPAGLVPKSMVTVDGKATVHIASGVVVVQRPGGTASDLAFKPGVTLDGAAVPAGLVRDRVIIAGDGKAHVAVVERFVGGGRGLEVLQVVRVDAESPHVVSTPVRDDVVISRLSAGLDGFWWIEGPATVMRVGD